MTDSAIKSSTTYPVKRIRKRLDWNEADRLDSFINPWSELPVPAMTFQALWDDLHLHFRFDVTADNVLTLIHSNNKLEVMDSDRVEIFFRCNEQLDPYFCLEMDSMGRVLDYRAQYYRKFDYGWQWPGTGDLMVQSAPTGSGYQVLGSVTLASLRQLGLLQQNSLQVGLFRGECLELAGTKSIFNWISWIKPDSGHPDFHIPSAFGMLELTGG
jgi:hypothetical protein